MINNLFASTYFTTLLPRSAKLTKQQLPLKPQHLLLIYDMHETDRKRLFDPAQCKIRRWYAPKCGVQIFNDEYRH